MSFFLSSSCRLLVLILFILHQANGKDNVEQHNNKGPIKTPEPQLFPMIPSLPTGTITGNTVDCVNEKFFKIQRENPQLGPWLTDVQRTVERLFAVRRQCDSETTKQGDCISAWNRAAGVQFLRLGLLLFEQENTKGNPLEILNVFLTGFQSCW